MFNHPQRDVLPNLLPTSPLLQFKTDVPNPVPCGHGERSASHFFATTLQGFEDCYPILLQNKLPHFFPVPPAGASRPCWLMAEVDLSVP